VKVGIVGLPNAGKSSLFNALTKAGAEAANYPFTTVEPNVAIVPVPDDRLDAVVDTVKATPTVYETIEFHDLEQAERRLEKVVREAKAGEREKVAEKQWLEQLVAALQAGRSARTVPVPEDAPDALRNLSPLTAKPVLYLANVDEEAAGTGDDGALAAPPEIVAHAESLGARAAAVSARLESELGELDDEEAAAMRAELGVAESGLATVVREAWKLLGLISFFTAGEGKEGRTWAITQGTSARRAAGKIHTDIEKGFVAAEVVLWSDLVEVGGYVAAREQAKLRVEGRDYEMRDGDVMTVRFTP
jgi:ribosome-binding ATPase